MTDIKKCNCGGNLELIKTEQVMLPKQSYGYPTYYQDIYYLACKNCGNVKLTNRIPK